MTRHRLAAATLAALAALGVATPADAHHHRADCMTVVIRWDHGTVRAVDVTTARDPDVMPVVLVQVLGIGNGSLYTRTVKGDTRVHVRPQVGPATAVVVTSGPANPPTCRAWVDAPTDRQRRTVTRVRAAA